MRVVGAVLGVLIGIVGLLVASYELLLDTFAVSTAEPYVAHRVTLGLLAMGFSLMTIAVALIPVRRDSRAAGIALILLALLGAVMISAPIVRWTLACSIIPGAMVFLAFRGADDQDQIWHRWYAAAAAKLHRTSQPSISQMPEGHSRGPQLPV